MLQTPASAPHDSSSLPIRNLYCPSGWGPAVADIGLGDEPLGRSPGRSSGKNRLPRSCSAADEWARRALVLDARELRAGVLQLFGPLAGPAESAGSAAAHIGGCCTACEVDVLAPVHPPRVGAARVAWEMPG